NGFSFLLVVRCSHTRELLAFQEFQGSAAAGGNMAHLVSIAHLVNCSSGISAANDRDGVGLSKSLRYREGTGCQCRVLEHTHRSVPYNGLRGLDSICEHLRGLRS